MAVLPLVSGVDVAVCSCPIAVAGHGVARFVRDDPQPRVLGGERSWRYE